MSSFRHFYNNKKTKITQSSIVNKIIEYVYFQNFQEILLKDKSAFINNIETQITEMIKTNNKGNESNYNSDLILYQKQKSSLISRYESDYSLLDSQYKKYKENPNEILYLTKYRKHCFNSDVTPLHKCPKNNTFGKFIEVIKTKNNNNNSFVVCTECRFCYKISFIKIYCSDCKCEYFSCKLNENEDENIFPATWKEYHCGRIIANEIMRCIKCENIFYLNLISKNLVCLNKKCNFCANPRHIIWKCKICKKDFRSGVKVYNPLEKQILENEIWKALILKQNAKPKIKLCCLKNDKNENIKYFHDKYCKGELYKGKMNNKDIVVCGKCHAVNFYDKFIWTCPKCNKKIFNIDNAENENKNNIKIKNNLKLIHEKESSRVKSKEHNSKILSKKHFSKNDLSFQYNLTKRKNTCYDLTKEINYSKREEIFRLKKDLTMPNLMNNSYLNKNGKNFQTESKPNYLKKFKRIKYKTLFDILEEREKYKLDNQSIEGNKNEQEKKETIKLAKNKLDAKFNKIRKKLLEESNLNTSKKIYKKIIFKQYLSPIHKTNNQKKNPTSKKSANEIKKRNLFKISCDKIKIISSDIDEETEDFIYKDLLYSKRYKEEHSTTTNDDYEKIEFRKNMKNSSKNHKTNIDLKKKFLKEQDNILEIQTPDKNFSKNIPEESNYLSYIYQNNNLNFSEQKKDKKEKNQSYSKGKEKNILLKKIYLDRLNIKKKEKFFRTKDNIPETILKDISKQNKDIIFDVNIKDINNKSDIKISPFDDLNKKLLLKEDFLNISKDYTIPLFKESDINYINSIDIDTNRVIYLVEDKKAKKYYALKRIICQDISDITKHEKEFELCYSLNHPNIIKIYNIFYQYLDSTTYLLYVLMEKAKSNWENEIEKRAETRNYYTEKELVNILKQLIKALLYLQNKGIAHRNIKPQNILICENNIYKLTDLGEAKQNKNENKLSTLKGNQLFMAPTLFFMLKYDGNCLKVKHNLFKSDVFSLGYCFLYAMALNIKIIKNIREETSMTDVILVIKKYDIDKRYSEKFMNIIYKMIQIEENKRYDFFELNEDININF